MPRRGPQPERILSYAAELDTLLSWVIAADLVEYEFGFDLLLHYAMDRVPVADKVRMIGAIIDQYDDMQVYDEFLDDLRSVDDIRVRVAHSVKFGTRTVTGPAYVSFRK